MKTTRIYKLNKPDYSDPIDIDELNENFDVIDFALEATQIKKTRVSNTISEKCILPYYRIRNNNDFDVTVTDRNFSVDYVIEAGKSKRFDVDGTNTDMNFYVQGLHEVEFEWFVFVKDAIEEGGGGGGTGGTKNYNELINQPKINGVTLTGDVALDTLGIKGAAGKDVDTTGTEVTSESTNVPTSAAVNAFVGSEIAKLGKPMEFKGKFSKAADVPDLSDTKEGWTYKVAVAGTYAGQKAKVGDAFISTGTAWEYFPSGDDEFSGENLLMSEYTKGSAKPESTDVSDTDTLNEAVQKIEWALADKVDKDITVNGKKLNANIVLSGNDEKLNATSYAKDEEAKDITKDSKIDEAVAQLEYRVDNKVNKTSVSSSNKTTSVIAIDDNSQMAMVAKISGKTHKTVNLFDMNAIYSDTSKFTKTSEGIKGTGTSFNSVSIPIPSNMIGKTYTFTVRGKQSDSLVGVYIKAIIKGVTAQAVKNTSVFDNITLTFKPETTSDELRISYGSNGTGYITISDMQVEEGSAFTQFEPYGQLWSAPVESVVSLGKNMFDKYSEWYKPSSSNDVTINADGSITVKGTWFCSTQINLQPNTDYTLSGLISGASVSGAMRIIDKDRNNTIAAITDIGTWKTATFNSGSNTTVHLALYSGNASSGNSTYRNIQLERGSTATALAPYNKTTVLVPSAVKNLPDYGLGIVKSDGTIVANEVDFENGVYYHRVSKFNLDVVLSGGLITGSSNYRWYTASAVSPAPKVSGLSGLVFISGKYTPDEAVVKTTTTAPNMTACFYTDKKFYFIDNSATTTTDARAKVKDVDVVYELAQEETLPLSDFVRPLPVEQGGTLTLVNEHNLDMPSVIKYKKEVN